ncbi:MAG: polysaccharide biosynthesis C-terminal domain-containing protein [Planctomycetota bacterium]
MLKDAFKRLSLHTLIYAGGTYLNRGVALLLTPLVTFYLPVEDYGVKELLGPTLAILTQIAGINVVNAMVRYYFEYEDERRRSAVISTTLLSIAAVSGTLVAILWFATPQIAPLILKPDRAPTYHSLLRVVYLIFFFQVVGQIGFKYLQAKEKSLLFGGIMLAKLVVEITLKIIFLAVFDMGLEALFYSVLIGESLTATIMSVALLGKLGAKIDVQILQKLWIFTLPLIFTGLAQFLLHSADRFMLEHLSDEDAVGLYGLSYQFGQLSNHLLLGPFMLIWYPFVFSLRDEGRQKMLCGRAFTHFMLLLDAGTLAVCLFARDIIELFASRPEYHVAYKAVPAVAIGYLFWASYQMIQTGFYVLKQTRLLPWLCGATAAANITLNWFIIPRYGFIGAAWTTTVTFALLAAACYVLIRRRFPVHYEWSRVAVAASWALALGLLGWFLPLHQGIWSWVLRAAILAAFPAGLLAVRFLKSDERAAIREVLHQVQVALRHGLRRVVR